MMTDDYGLPLTPEQVQRIAELVAARSLTFGLTLTAIGVGQFHDKHVLLGGWSEPDASSGQSYGEWLISPEGLVSTHRGPGAGDDREDPDQR
jgi:hypothetical protein